MSEQLKPCPFCGDPAELETDNDHHGEWFNLGCQNHWGQLDPDDACIGGRLFYTEDMSQMEAAITAWNTRTIEGESHE
ncbi:Lar family restriction alleviation protein [Roseovarius sp.]|uniref:Lar family restriction alleviation protein n=1 Tax=Roseovarius sp. TaxID=1486281 RepID=UPI003BAB7256